MVADADAVPLRDCEAELEVMVVKVRDMVIDVRVFGDVAAADFVAG